MHQEIPLCMFHVTASITKAKRARSRPLMQSYINWKVIYVSVTCSDICHNIIFKHPDENYFIKHNARVLNWSNSNLMAHKVADANLGDP
jgi:hypothetical protein